MKKLFLLLILGASFKLSSQDVASCSAAQNICTNPNFIFQAGTSHGLVVGLGVSNPNVNPQTGNGSNPTASANQGCLMTQGPGPQWLILTVSVSGNLGFIFGAPASANPQVGLYDWAMWPYTPSTCANIFNNTLPPVSCNWNATNSGGTGMGTVPASGNVGNYQPSLAVTAGQQFLILISNYSGVNTSVSFTSTGTASLTCGFNTAICAGSTTTVTPTGFVSLSGSSYTLFPGNFNNTTGIFTVTPTSTTIYTITGAGLNSQGAQITQSSTTSIVVNPQPVLAPTYTQATCTNPSATLNLHLSFIPASPSPSYTVAWSSIPSQLGSSTSTTVSPVDPNQYTTTVVAAGGCSTVAQFTINPQPAPATFTMIPLTNVFSVTCAQPTVVIDASNNALTYTWTNGSAAPVYDNEALFTLNTLGTWTITGKNSSSGCIASHTFLVVQNTVAPSAVVTPSFQNITCLNGAITVTSTSNATVNITQYFTFNGPGGTYSTSANSPTAIVLPPIGQHVVCVVNNLNGCSSCKTFSIVSSDNIPTINLTSPENYTLGCGTHSVAHVALTGSTTPQGGGVEYALASPAFTGTNYAFSGSQSVYSITAPGTWTAVIRDQTSHCLIKASFSIIQDIAGPDIAAFNPHPILNCDTNATVLTAITSNTNVTFAWSYPSQAGPVTIVNSTVAAGTNTNHNIALAANYTLSITDNHNACISTSIVPVAQNLYIPVAVISGGVTFSLTCANPTVQLTNNSTHNTAMAAAGYPTNLPVIGYIWAGPPPQAPLQVSSNYIAGLAGIYTLTAKDLNNGCIGTATTNVLENRIYPILESPGDVVFACGTPSAVVTLTPGAGTKYRYDWATASPTVNAAPNQPTLGVLGTGEVGVTITNTVNGCHSFLRANIISGTLTADVIADHVSGYAPLTVTFNNNSYATTNPTPTNPLGHDLSGITTVWSFANGQQTVTPSGVTASATYSQSGTYNVLAYATKGVCQSIDTLTITVDVPSRLEIPNVFTPNGDNVNDLFFLKVANLTEIHMQIFDRWGHTVYDLTSETGNIAWDGKTETGKDAASGTYFYIIKATGKDGQSYDTKGTVNLYR